MNSESQQEESGSRLTPVVDEVSRVEFYVVGEEDEDDPWEYCEEQVFPEPIPSALVIRQLMTAVAPYLVGDIQDGYDVEVVYRMDGGEPRKVRFHFHLAWHAVDVD